MLMQKQKRLVEETKRCLEIGAEAARPWGFVGDIGRAIEKYAKSKGYTVVRELAGHGVGLEFHEDPIVDHYDTHHRGMLLVPGMVFTIEPNDQYGRTRCLHRRRRRLDSCDRRRITFCTMGTHLPCYRNRFGDSHLLMPTFLFSFLCLSHFSL